MNGMAIMFIAAKNLQSSEETAEAEEDDTEEVGSKTPKIEIN